MPWDPEQYHRFRQQREQSFRDLLLLIDKREGQSVIDLGCGTGELTARLQEALPGSAVLGVDSSESMLEEARGLAREGLRFERGRIEEVEGEYDLVFSHAALQWLPDHPTLIPRLMGLVAPGGQIAIQVPANYDHPQQTFLGEVAQESPFREAFGGAVHGEPRSLDIREYAQLLWESGAVDINVFAKIYAHEMPDADAIAEWTKGTAMIPYLEQLPEDLRAAFEERYRAKLRERYPEEKVFFGFKRILMVARHSGERRL